MKKIHLILAAAALACTATLTGCVSAQSQTLASKDVVHIQTDKLSNGKYKMYGIAVRY